MEHTWDTKDAIRAVDIKKANLAGTLSIGKYLVLVCGASYVQVDRLPAVPISRSHEFFSPPTHSAAWDGSCKHDGTMEALNTGNTAIPFWNSGARTIHSSSNQRVEILVAQLSGCYSCWPHVHGTLLHMYTKPLRTCEANSWLVSIGDTTATTAAILVGFAWLGLLRATCMHRWPLHMLHSKFRWLQPGCKPL